MEYIANQIKKPVVVEDKPKRARDSPTVIDLDSNEEEQ
jgi:hypothetical protein